MPSKSLMIKDVSVQNIEKFHSGRKRLKLTSSGYFDKILNTDLSLTIPENTPDNSAEKLQELEEQFSKCDKTNIKLLAKIKELENKAPVEVEKEVIKEVEKKLTGTQFIFEPSDEMAKKIKRVIAYERKEGNLKDLTPEQYLQKITSVALNYFIKNEYSHLF